MSQNTSLNIKLGAYTYFILRTSYSTNNNLSNEYEQLINQFLVVQSVLSYATLWIGYQLSQMTGKEQILSNLYFDKLNQNH